MKNIESVLQEMVKKHKKLVEESEKELDKLGKKYILAATLHPVH